jgi:hypothetical protein
VRGTPVRTDRLALDLTAQMSTNDNKITSLQPGQYFVIAGTFLRHQVGYPAFGWFEKRVVSATIDRTTGATSNVMCADTLPGSHGKEATGAKARPRRRAPAPMGSTATATTRRWCTSVAPSHRVNPRSAARSHS